MTPSSRGVEARLVDRILVISIDTPGELNVLTRDVAKQLTSILHEVHAGTVDAVVLRSEKPASFINGVGLMLAGAVQTPEDVTRLSSDVRACYRMLGELEVPTIAAIRGNCYGCGVELVLRCDHRIAADDWATHFYMPELVDYLFVPCFGGTWELPRLVGLPRATELLLWGARWTGSEATRARLVDACVTYDDFDDAIFEYARDVVHDRRPPATAAGPALVDPGWVDAMWERIDALPHPQRLAYRECFDLMHRAATTGGDPNVALGRELLASGRTMVTSASKSAQAFFFVRQTAELTTVGTTRERAHYRLVPAARSDLLAELATRRAADVVVGPIEPLARSDERTLTIGSPANPAEVIACTEPSAQSLAGSGDVIAYAPLLCLGSNLVEVACRPHAVATGRALADALRRAGMQPVLSTPAKRFLTDELAEAYAAPLFAFVEEGGTLADVVATLHRHGRMRPLGDLARLFPEGHASRLLFAGAPPSSGTPSPPLLDALYVSLAAAALRALDTGTARHPTIVDVVAREALDWPLSLPSLCRTLDVETLREKLRDVSRFAHLIRPADRERAESWTERGRSLYA